jgi:hypothetical protein
MTEGLSMEDYFLVYLGSGDPNPQLLREAAKMMSPEEVHELMRLMLKTKQEAAPRTGAREGAFLTQPTSRMM